MKKKTFLFFPVEVGLAHITRSLVIAEVLQKQGHNIVFTLPNRKQNIFKSSTIRFTDISPYATRDEQQFLTSMRDTRYYEPFVREERQLVEKIHPDGIFLDFRVSVLASCSNYHIPIYWITGSSGLPYGCHLPNPQFPPIIFTTLKPFIQKIIWKTKESYVNKLLFISRQFGYQGSALELFQTLRYIVPEYPNYLPALNNHLSITYTGPLSWEGFNGSYRTYNNYYPSNEKSVYITFGGTGFNKQKLISLSKQFLKNNWVVYVSSSTIADPMDFPTHKNLFVERFFNGKKLSMLVDLVVCHGGYGTMMDAILAQKPVIAIPFNPDQFLHAFRFQELGMGICMIPFSMKFVMNFLQLNWSGFEQAGNAVLDSDVVKTAERMMGLTELYRKTIKNFLPENNIYSGTSRISDII